MKNKNLIVVGRHHLHKATGSFYIQTIMTSLLQTLLKPDHNEHPEKELIAQAANILQVGEFQLLQLAYYEWHGRDMLEMEMNNLFSAYMIDNIIPHWARDFARKILARDAAGETSLDRDPAYHRYDPNYVTHVTEGRRKFITAVIAISSIFVLAIAASEMKTRSVTSVLPPYFEIEDLDRKGE